MGQHPVQLALVRISHRLRDLRIPHAIAGGMAVTAHGHFRTTDDVDLLVTADSLKRIHEHLDGLGYVPPFAGSKNLKDTTDNTRIEFLVTGQFPGDGKPKPVAFPDPLTVSVDIDGIPFISLATLIELKLASGMTNTLRAKDIGDVIDLIRVRQLDASFGQQLNPFVRSKFVELVSDIQRETADAAE